MAEMKGMREALETMRRLPDHIASKGGGPVRRALFKAAKPWLDQATDNAAGLGPGVHSGRIPDTRLKDSIVRRRDSEPERDGFLERVFVTYNPKKAWWGAFVENGTEKQAAQPFLRPVLDQVGDRPIGIFADSIRRDIERIAERLRK